MIGIEFPVSDSGECHNDEIDTLEQIHILPSSSLQMLNSATAKIHN